MAEDVAKCELCGEPMPPGETMFKFHGFSGPCPKPPLPPTRFKKKPVIIEAKQFLTSNVEELLQWINGGNTLAMDRPAICMAGAPNITIRTLEGDMRAEHGDWIIKGVKGEFYPCKPDIFEATYEATPETP